MNKWLQVRIKPQEHEEVDAYAKEHGMTIAGMIRFALRTVFKIKL